MKIYLILAVQLLIIKLATSQTGCPIEDDPTNLARCIQVDISAIVSAAKGSNDFTAFCALASRYMECFITYSRGCVGGYVGQGTFNELINTAYYCCNGVTSSPNCPFNPNVKRKCIDGEANVKMADGSLRKIKSLEVGDKIKTLDNEGNLIDTDVIMMLDVGTYESLFLNIKTYSQKSLRVSVEHLMATENGEFKLAKYLNKNDIIITYDYEKNMKLEEKIESILIEPVDAFVAPLTQAGTLLVEGILASSYAVVHSQTLAHSAMAPLRWWYSFSNMIDTFTPSANLNFEKQMNGTHWYPILVHSLADQLLSNVVKFN